jgi:SAM-dependent methyltransferase
MCPQCGALERHRFVWLYFAQRTNLFDARPKRLLHIAPEPCFRDRLARHIGAGYVTADMRREGVAETMDIMNIPHPDRSFDIVYCSHVLEHVPNDRAAMRECARVLEPTAGWAMLLVPITAPHTDEDPSITDPAERLRRFGQGDHVRRYGPDYVDRLRDAGFVVEVVRVADVAAPSAALRMGLSAAAGELYHCRRAVDPATTHHAIP